MIAKNGDRVRAVEDVQRLGVRVIAGQQGEMVDKTEEDDCGGSVLLDSGGGGLFVY